MADFGIMIAEKLVDAIASEVIKEICALWGYESQLEELKETVTTIQRVLLDAEAKRELSNEQQQFISELKDAVYDADDLFDEFRTLAELKEIQPLNKTGKVYEKVRRFFSSKNQVGLAYRMSRDVKDIKKRLDGITDNHQKYGFSVDYKPIIRRREDTCSYVGANDIIGRDNDKEAIVDMLLTPNNNGEDFVAVTVVGVGGLGKTALAQLVFNDERIEKEFHASRFWVCVSDQDGVTFEVKPILCKILEVLPKDGVDHQKLDGSSSMELVQQQFQERMRGKKYLLVLDDIWNEDRKKWDELKRFLILGQSGSRVVVTTRSERTGTIIDKKHAYKLDGLSEDDSWLLFEMSAFDITNKPEHYHEYVTMGKKIVAKCYNIPLALKVVGSLLFDQGIDKWRSFEDAGLAHIGKGNNEILSILKLSYYNLQPSFKYCFGYCALFPKDYEFKKQNLISLWMAQGYITPLNDGQCVEDAAEEHFVILLRRCFFQDVKKDEYDEITTVKIHDLMHDVALEVGREEFFVVTSLADIPGDKTRHVRYEEEDTATLKRPLGNSKIRSFICQRRVSKNCVVTQFDKWMCLRVLDLRGEGFENLPRSIGKLLHLRYLNLSYNHKLKVLPNEITRLHNLQTLLLRRCSNLLVLLDLPEDFSKLVNLRHLDLDGCEELQCMPRSIGKLLHLRYLELSNNFCLDALPNEITRLHNLQTLLLCNCRSLRKLPEDFSKLVNLRHLDLDGCDKLQCMPSGMGKMTSLKVLPSYVVGRNDGRDGLKALKALTGIRGGIWIRIDKNYKEEEEGVDEREGVGGYLKGMQHLTKIRIPFNVALENHEAVLENLEPPSNVKELNINGYMGKTIPKWGRAMDNWASSLSHLVQISLQHCSNLEEMPVLSRLPHLKSLDLEALHNLEYMEMDITRSDGGTKSSEEFFPSLVTLKIGFLLKLKEWWKKSSEVVDDCSSSYNSRFTLPFPRLSELKILCCPNLTSILPCPRIERLELKGNNRSLQVIGNTSEAMDDNTAGNSQQHLKLLKLETDNLDLLKSLPINRLASFRLFDFEDVDSTILEILASSLQTLQVDKMKTLRRLCGETWLQNFPNFTALVDLSVGDYLFDDIEEENELEQSSFPPNLHSLKFTNLSKMKSLPKGMQCLTSLQTLELHRCEQLEALPEWISCLSSLKSLSIRYCPALKSLPQAMHKLTSLQSLTIYRCPELGERCKEPDGEDRPKIQHIPNIKIFLVSLSKSIYP